MNNMMMKTSLLGTTLGLLGSMLPAAARAVPRPHDVERYFTSNPDGSTPADPFLANGVALGRDVATYSSSGTGPAALNVFAPADTPARYIDYTLVSRIHPDFSPTPEEKARGALPEGMTITEAQALNCLARVQENLEEAGLTLSDTTFMRAYLDNVEGEARADYAGWNRSYRRFVANVSLVSGAIIPAYEPVIFPNATRPGRVNFEVASLPVLGWLVEIEVVGAYRVRR